MSDNTEWQNTPSTGEQDNQPETRNNGPQQGEGGQDNKRPRRPRIQNNDRPNGGNRFDEYGQPYAARGSQHRTDGYGQPRTGGYAPRSGGYQGRYHNAPQDGNGPSQEYGGRPQDGEDFTAESMQSYPRSSADSYQPRQGGYGGYNRQGSYGYNNRQDGYGQQRQGGYQRREGGGYGRQQNGYGQQRQANGYQYRQGGGYNRSQEGYQPRQGGYNNRQGGYNNRQQGGGYQHREGGGYGRSQGGYQRREGGYNGRPQNGYGSQRARFVNPSFGKRRIEYKEYIEDPDAPIRLNKFLANAGVCSRREADQFIEAGVVKVNGETVTELGTKVLRTDTIHFHDQLVTLEKKVYVLLNKPKDYVTTSDDPQQRKTVLELVRGACRERIYPVGRLDRGTMGVLLLTNDGELASKLTHPKYLKRKIYHVFLDKNVTAADLKQIAEGVTLEDGTVRADDISYASDTDKKQVGIEIHSGKNRIVRRIFESLGYRVLKLDRVMFAGLTKKGLKRGDWRFLTEQEVAMLHMGQQQVPDGEE